MVINPIGAPNVDRNDATNTHPLVIDIKKTKVIQEKSRTVTYLPIYLVICSDSRISLMKQSCILIALSILDS